MDSTEHIMPEHRTGSGMGRRGGTCTDCGRSTFEWTRCLDPHTHSEVDLCTGCMAAFRQRQHVPPGCCG